MKKLIKKIKWNIKRWHIMAIVIIGLVFLDLWSKWLVRLYISPAGEEISIIGDFLVFVHHINTGAAWSSFEGQVVFLSIVTLISLAGMGWVIKSYKKHPSVVYSITVAIGGALGNFYQRLFNEGRVTDFISLRFGSYTFPTFNVADMAIVGGLFAATIFAAKAEYGKNKD